MDNLEHGWLVGNNLEDNEFVGYCSVCDKPLYESDEYIHICRELYCEHCGRIERRRMRGEETDE